jgi:arylsulfatase A-like enzyme
MGLARASPCATGGSGSGSAETVRVAVGTTPHQSGPYYPQQPLTPYVEAGLAPALSASEKADPGGNFLPLVRQVHSTNGVVETKVLEQPLDLSKLSRQYETYATSFIAANARRPFFLYMPFSHVHTTASNQPEEQYCDCEHKNATKRGAFGDALAEVDELVGKVVAALRAHKIDRNTLTLFTGDNGPWLVKGTSGGSTGLLGGRFSGYWNVGKGSTWEGGIREAGFAHWPSVISPASRSSEIVSSMDVFPTVLKLAGLTLPTDRAYDGKDFSSILFDPNGKSGHEVLFFYGGANGIALPSAARYGAYKAHWVTGPGLGACDPSPSAPIGCPYINYTGGPLVFNVERDPSEAYALTYNTTTPSDPELSKVVAKFISSYAQQVASLVRTQPPPAPDRPGEGPGKYGVCCNRTLGCDCDGPPSA